MSAFPIAVTYLVNYQFQRIDYGPWSVLAHVCYTTAIAASMSNIIDTSLTQSNIQHIYFFWNPMLNGLNAILVTCLCYKVKACISRRMDPALSRALLIYPIKSGMVWLLLACIDCVVWNYWKTENSFNHANASICNGFRRHATWLNIFVIMNWIYALACIEWNALCKNDEWITILRYKWMKLSCKQ